MKIKKLFVVSALLLSTSLYAEEYKMLFNKIEKPFVAASVPAPVVDPSTACVFGSGLKAVFWLQWPNHGGHAWLNFNVNDSYPYNVGAGLTYITNLYTPVNTFYSAYPDPDATYNDLVSGSIDPVEFLDNSIFSQEFLHNGYYFTYGEFKAKQMHYEGGMVQLDFELCHRPA